jgi:hypothetical protein
MQISTIGLDIAKHVLLAWRGPMLYPPTAGLFPISRSL